MRFVIRPFHLSDMPALYRICVQTSNYGADATADYRDPELLGHYYAGPYGALEPDLAFILTADNAPSGYVLAARDSQAFYERCEAEWFPVLRARYPLPPDDDNTPDAGMIRAIHRGIPVHPDLTAYPAHLHIDLLPHAVGQGWGRRMMATLLARLRELNVPGVHLGVGIGNQRAIAFYERCGFARLHERQWGILFGMLLHE